MNLTDGLSECVPNLDPIVLLGDTGEIASHNSSQMTSSDCVPYLDPVAAHPPVPYIGQGAMMAMEDAGVLSRLLRHYCCAAGTKPFDPSDANMQATAAMYQQVIAP